MSFAAEKLILQSCNSQVAAAMCTTFPQPVSSASALCSDKAATVQQPAWLSNCGGDSAKLGDEVTDITVEMGQLYEGRDQN